ncbi:MAG: hypothetical protein ACYC8T_30800, partial [Myxococcaceae bacterium]
GCITPADAFDFTGKLYPGAYKVTVTRSTYDSSYAQTNLPTWSTVVNPAFSVQGNASNVVFEVPVAPEYTVSGRLTRNGVNPTATYCGTGTNYRRAVLDFEHTTDTRFNRTLYVNGCITPAEAFDFTGKLYPGVYKVTVTRSTYDSSYAQTNLPIWPTVVVERLQVP